ncbi:MAG: hypothetical protein ACLT8E_01105 [Akkermansia sp.]
MPGKTIRTGKAATAGEPYKTAHETSLENVKVTHITNPAGQSPLHRTRKATR